uniref:RNA transcription, translation and transport factor protein n=1 Tax=Myxine glutinosa TaxID=7769 RepID=UPI00358F4836
MFRRKLLSLEYHNSDGFNCSDENEFRNVIIWLEDQKIRHYKIEERGNLRNVHSNEWPKYFEQYLLDICCPFNVKEKIEAVDWLLGLAVRLEYADNVEKYKNVSVEVSSKNSAIMGASSDSIMNIDVNNPDVRAGISALANQLQIPLHDDYLLMLKAARILVQERLSPADIIKENNRKEGIPIPLHQNELGFETGDSTLNEAARILRLLHIEELRELQTRINEAVVAVQCITADPKTDQRLGRVGR